MDELKRIVNKLGDVFSEHLDRLATLLPTLLTAVVLLLVGWLLARAVRGLVRRLLSRAGLDAAVERAGMGQVLQRFGPLVPSQAIGSLAYWLVLLLLLLAVADILGMGSVTRGIEGFFAYLPTLCAALAIFLFGLWLAEKVKQALTTLLSSVGVGGGKVVAQVLHGLIALFMTITALNVAGIDTTLITSNILLVIGAVLVAFSIAYGMAARGILTNILSSYYGKDRFQVGQRVRIGADEGIIERIDSISITLDTGDRKVVLPCSLLTTERIEIRETPTSEE